MDTQLISDLQKGNDQQRRAASYKLGKLKDLSVVPYLICAYNDRDPSVRRNIIEGLNNINTKEAADFLNLPEHMKQAIVQQLQQSPTAQQLQKILFEYIHEFPQKKPAQDAVNHYERARALEKQSGGEMDITRKKDILAELALAIKKADAPFPEAHAMIARFFFKLEDDRNAEYNANIALQQDSNQFYAQLVKIDLASEKVRKQAQQGMKSLDSSSSLISTLLISGVGMSQVNSAISTMRNEIIKLVNIFRMVCEGRVESDKYLWMSEQLIELGDFIQEITPFPGGRPNLYAEVVNIPIEKIEIKEDVEQNISEVRTKAEGRSLTFKPN